MAASDPKRTPRVARARELRRPRRRGEAAAQANLHRSAALLPFCVTARGEGRPAFLTIATDDANRTMGWQVHANERSAHARSYNPHTTTAQRVGAKTTA